jgi:hypothetical protein
MGRVEELFRQMFHLVPAASGMPPSILSPSQPHPYAQRHSHIYPGVQTAYAPEYRQRYRNEQAFQAPAPEIVHPTPISSRLHQQYPQQQSHGSTAVSHIRPHASWRQNSNAHALHGTADTRPLPGCLQSYRCQSSRVSPQYAPDTALPLGLDTAGMNYGLRCTVKRPTTDKSSTPARTSIAFLLCADDVIK